MEENTTAHTTRQNIISRVLIYSVPKGSSPITTS